MSSSLRAPLSASTLSDPWHSGRESDAASRVRLPNTKRGFGAVTSLKRRATKQSPLGAATFSIVVLEGSFSPVKTRLHHVSAAARGGGEKTLAPQIQRFFNGATKSLKPRDEKPQSTCRNL